MPSITTAPYERTPATARTSAASGDPATESLLTDASGLRGRNGADGIVKETLGMPDMASELHKQARPEGLEPPTLGLEVCRAQSGGVRFSGCSCWCVRISMTRAPRSCWRVLARAGTFGRHLGRHALPRWVPLRR